MILLRIDPGSFDPCRSVQNFPSYHTPVATVNQRINAIYMSLSFRRIQPHYEIERKPGPVIKVLPEPCTRS